LARAVGLAEAALEGATFLDGRAGLFVFAFVATLATAFGALFTAAVVGDVVLVADAVLGSVLVAAPACPLFGFDDGVRVLRSCVFDCCVFRFAIPILALRGLGTLEVPPLGFSSFSAVAPVLASPALEELNFVRDLRSRSVIIVSLDIHQSPH
jgi:hypothetical protein